VFVDAASHREGRKKCILLTGQRVQSLDPVVCRARKREPWINAGFCDWPRRPMSYRVVDIYVPTERVQCPDTVSPRALCSSKPLPFRVVNQWLECPTPSNPSRYAFVVQSTRRRANVRVQLAKQERKFMEVSEDPLGPFSVPRGRSQHSPSQRRLGARRRRWSQG